VFGVIVKIWHPDGRYEIEGFQGRTQAAMQRRTMARVQELLAQGCRVKIEKDKSVAAAGGKTKR